MAATKAKAKKKNPKIEVLDPQPSNERPAQTTGEGGETHQTSTGVFMTTAQGVPIADAQNSLRVGTRGPVTLSDFQLREKIFAFDHERIPERVVHARGYGAHGYFETYESAADITSADIFARAGERTPAFVRFSTVAGSQGSADLARDVRGFAVKLYTQEGNWDIVGNNIPVFFVQDALKFPDLVHAVKPEPDRGFPQAASAHDNFWDFASLMPETTHMLMWVMSDRGLPRSFRFMAGFGVHTFRMVNASGESTFVKFHWKPSQGVQSVVWPEAVKINGADPDFHRRDLWDAVNRGDFPQWELGVQVFGEAFADSFEFDVLDATKLIPEEIVPIRPLGVLVLDRVVDNFFAETEQVAFCTQNIVPGIDFSNDPLLAGRNFSYLDTQTKRLGGPNFTQLPVNAPKCPFSNFQQDGHMAFRNPVGRVNYEPNSWSGIDAGPREDPEAGFLPFPADESGSQRRGRPAAFADHYSQARQFLLSQTPVEQIHIVDAFVFELSKVEFPAIRERMVGNLANVSDAFANLVAQGLGMADMPPASESAAKRIDNIESSPSLSILANPVANFSGRKVGALVSDGCDASAVAALRDALKTEGATLEIVAPKIGGVVATDGSVVAADHTISSGPSVLFDAVVVGTSPAALAELAANPSALDFVRDAHAHCKIVGYLTDASLELVGLAGVEADNGYVDLSEGSDDFVALCRDLRFWERDATPARYPMFDVTQGIEA
jgi:catalase